MTIDIKKRSASNIYYGVHKDTGELLHISEVPSGLKCGCICAACGQPFEAKKGDVYRHHFAHVSNYDCVYASEVTIYKAMAAALEKEKHMRLPALKLIFPTWDTGELLWTGKTVPVDSVEFRCEPNSYPPILMVHFQSNLLRILLDFDHYYDSSDLLKLSSQAQKDGYALLCYSLPAINNNTEFTPERVFDNLKQSKNATWVFSRLEQQWKEKYYAAASEPQGLGAGFHCPICIDRYNGEPYARRIDCARCRFNVATPPACLCMAIQGIQKKDDFDLSKEELAARIQKIRDANERSLLEREERAGQIRQARQDARNFPVRQVFDSQQTSRPPRPSQEQLDAEYKRICEAFDANAEEWTVDCYDRRWLLCECCGQIKRDSEMAFYGGIDGQNKGICSVCSRKQT